jgi:ATP:corrinoid adenosyltransferase
MQICVFFIDPKQSYIEIIQNIGRVCRKNDKTLGLATILIPTYVDVNKYKDCKNEVEQDEVIRSEMSKTGDFNGILSVLSALRQEDPYMFELCLNSPNAYTGKEIKDCVKRSGNELEYVEYTCDEIFENYKMKYNNKIGIEDNFVALSDKVKRNINIINKKIDEDDINVGNYEETINLIKTDDDKFMKVNGKNKIKRPNRNIKPKYHINDEIRVLWQVDSNLNVDKKVFGGYISCNVKMSSDEQWLEKLEQVKKYIDDNDKRPSTTDKNNKIKQLGQWISDQNKYYKKNIGRFNNSKIRIIYKHFLEKYKKYFLDNESEWIIKLNKVKEYIDKNNKKPYTKDKNNEYYTLSNWLSIQSNNYNNKNDIMKNENIYNKWTEFINDEKYKIYFLDNESAWINKLNKVKEYINENNKRPCGKSKNSDIQKLGTWIQTQITNYKNKNQIMSNEEIYNKWTEFINDEKYKIYFLDNETIWNDNLKLIKKYINKNNKLPSRNESRWIEIQNKNYRNKTQIMTNDTIRNQWENFITKYKKYFPNNSAIKQPIN